MLKRYLLREVSLPYLLGVLLFIGLITTDLLSSLSGALLARGTPISDVLLLVLYRLPYTLGVALPLGLVFAILVGLARLIRDSELKAAYAGGVAPLSFLPPILALALLVAGIVFANAAWIKPKAQDLFEKKLYQVYYGTEPTGVLYKQGYAPPGLGVYYAERVYPSAEGGAVLEGVRVVEPSGVIWSAERGRWVGKNWVLKRPWRIEGSSVEPWERVALPFPARYLPRAARGYEGLSLFELKELARVDPKARFPLARRYADAAGVVVLAWLALVVGLSLREAAWAFALVVLLIFGYYVLWVAAARLAGVAAVGPAAAWLPNLVYGTLAAFGTVRLR